jgi:hypothetical protein
MNRAGRVGNQTGILPGIGHCWALAGRGDRRRPESGRVCGRLFLFQDGHRRSQHNSQNLLKAYSTVLASEIVQDPLVPLVVLLVGRPGLAPGTLGLKEGCIWSDWSGGVGIIRESKKTCLVASDW